MTKCENSPDGIHAVKYMPKDIVKVLNGEITMEEYASGQFCIYCGKAIW